MSDFDYEKYEQECNKIREENEEHLVEFEKYLVDAGLKDATIKRHISNVDFYINTYLLREDAYRIRRGCYTTDDFLGYFFIRKCMWSTPSTIRQNAASFKKFYKCMLEHGHIEQADYDALRADIKEGMPIWIQECEEFNNPDSSLIQSDFEHAFADILYQSLLDELGVKYPELVDGLSAANQVDEADDEPLTREEAVAFLTLSLFYLTSWVERGRGKGAASVRRAWKSADWNALDFLQEAGFISCSNKAKSVYITESGIAEAQELLTALGLAHLV